MRQGSFEVTKEEFERAREGAKDKTQKSFYMAGEDVMKHFDDSILCGYGLYDCKIYEEDGKYVCRYYTGSSCD